MRLAVVTLRGLASRRMTSSWCWLPCVARVGGSDVKVLVRTRGPLGLSVWLWCISHTVSHPTDPCQAKATLNRKFLVARWSIVARELDAAELGMTHVIVARPRASSLSNVQVRYVMSYHGGGVFQPGGRLLENFSRRTFSTLIGHRIYSPRSYVHIRGRIYALRVPDPYIRGFWALVYTWRFPLRIYGVVYTMGSWVLTHDLTPGCRREAGSASTGVHR
jgi:hypothetical protein